MKIKLSKKQWETIGKTAGWFEKTAFGDIGSQLMDIQALNRAIIDFLEKNNSRLSRYYPSEDPNDFENDVAMREKIAECEQYVGKVEMLIKDLSSKLLVAKEAISELKDTYSVPDPSIEQENRDFRQRVDSGDPTAIAWSEQ